MLIVLSGTLARYVESTRSDVLSPSFPEGRIRPFYRFVSERPTDKERLGVGLHRPMPTSQAKQAAAIHTAIVRRHRII